MENKEKLNEIQDNEGNKHIDNNELFLKEAKLFDANYRVSANVKYPPCANEKYPPLETIF